MKYGFWKRIVSGILTLSMLFTITPIINVSDAVGTFKINVIENSDGFGSTTIRWDEYDYMNKVFKVYKSSNHGTTFETVGLDYESINEVKILQIYPVAAVENQLKTWLIDNGYGKGIMKVDSVLIDTFNANPYAYLKDSNGNWKYDVIFFGSYDSNGSKGISAAAKTATEAFILAGKGCIFGHDTISWDSYGGTSERSLNFNELAKYVNIVRNDYWAAGQSNLSSYVKISKKGLFTTYPWEIGELGTILTIPPAHCVGQTANGEIWLLFANQTAITPENNPANFYLTTWNNCAMIQTGHSNGTATVDEQKIIANLMFYMNQLLADSCVLNDKSGQDTTPPQIISFNVKDGKINVTAKDYGTDYYYYVESYSKDDTTASGLLDVSETKTITVTTGFTGCRYLFSNNASDVLTKENGTYVAGNAVPITGGYQYIHIAPVDEANNVGNTIHYKIESGINANPASKDWSNNIPVSITYENINGLKDAQIIVNNSSTMPSSGFEDVLNTTQTKLTVNKNITANGTNYIHAKATDVYGNVTTKTFGPYRFDKEKPQINSHNITKLSLLPQTFSRSVFASNTGVRITLNHTENFSGINKITYKLGGMTSYQNMAFNGTNYYFDINQNYDGSPISIKAYDKAGNVSDEYVITGVKLANSPPVIEITNNSNWTNANSLTFPVTVYDAMDLMEITNVTFETSETKNKQSGNLRHEGGDQYYVDVYNEGEYTFTVYAVNEAGSENYKTSTPVRIDRTPPVIKDYDISLLTDPASASPFALDPMNTITNKAVKVDLTITDNLSGLDYVEYQLPGDLVWTALNKNETSFVIDEEINGDINLRVRDITGNVSGVYKITGLVIDATKPEINLGSVPSWTNRDVEVDIDISDDIGLESIAWFTTEDPSQATAQGEVYTPDEFPGKVILSNEGMYTFIVSAYDKAGNVTEVESEVIKIDKTKPYISDISYFVPQASILSLINDNEEEEESVCICNTRCSTSDISEDCDICINDFTDCKGITLTCSCETKCSENLILDTCEKCLSNYSSCEGEAVSEPECICENKCTVENVSNTCGVCQDNFEACEGKEIETELEEAETPLADIFAQKVLVRIHPEELGVTKSGIKNVWYRLVNSEGQTIVEDKELTKDTDGFYTFYVENDFTGTVTAWCQDIAGNMSDEYSEDIIVDLTDPNPSMDMSTSPDEWSTVPGRVVINIEDYNGLNSVWYTQTPDGTGEIRDEELLTSQGDKYFETEIVIDTDGIYEITIDAEDIAGNMNSETKTIKVDTTSPVIDLVRFHELSEDGTTVLQEDCTVTNKRLLVEVDVSDNLSGFNYMEYQTMDSPIWHPVAAGVTEFSLATAYSGNIKIRIYDEAGNVSQIYTSINLIIETVAPNLDVSIDEEWSPTPVFLTVDAYDDDSEIKSVTYTYKAEDNIVENKSIPVSNGSILTDISFCKEGNYKVTFTATDNAGNTSSEERTIKIDTTQPVIDDVRIHEINLDNQSISKENCLITNKRLLIEADVNDNLSGFDFMEYQFQGSDIWEPLDSGVTEFIIDETYTGYVKIRIYDNAGNISSIFTSNVLIIETDAPVLEIATNDNWNPNTIYLDVDSYDTGSKIQSLTYEYTAEDNVPVNESLSVLNDGVSTQVPFFKEGDYDVTFTATDHAGNTTSEQRTVKIDTTQPVIDAVGFHELSEDGTTIIRENCTVTNKRLLVEVDVSDNLSGFSYMEYQLDGDWISLEVGTTEFSIDNAYTGFVNIRIYDNAGNISTIFTSNTLIIERVAPVLEVSTHAEWSSTPIHLDLEVFDSGSEIKSVVYTYIAKDGILVSESVPVVGGRVSTEVILSKDGTYDVVFTATDNAGNTSSETRIIKIEADAEFPAPDVDFDEYIPGEWSPTTLNVYVGYNNSADVPDNGIKKYQHRDINNNEWIDGLPSLLETMDKTFVFRAVSNLNVASNETIPFNCKIDLIKPVVQAESIENKSSNRPIEINLSIIEEDSATKSVEYSFNGADWMDTIQKEENEYMIILNDEYRGNVFVRAIDNVDNISDILIIRDLNIDYGRPKLDLTNYINIKDELVLKVSEFVDKGTDGYIRITDLSAASHMAPIELHVSNNRIKVDKDIITVNVGGLLEFNKRYSIEVDEGFVYDASKNMSINMPERIFSTITTPTPSLINILVSDEKGANTYPAVFDRETNDFNVVIPTSAKGNLVVEPVFDAEINSFILSSNDLLVNAISGKEYEIKLNDETVFPASLFVEYLDKKTEVNFMKGDVNVSINSSIQAEVEKSDVLRSVDIASNLEDNVVYDLIVNINEDLEKKEDVIIAENFVKNIEECDDVSTPIDISVILYKTKNGIKDNGEVLSELQNELNIVLEIPEELINNDYYGIVRVHNGIAQMIPCEINYNKISFSSDKFSSYFIVTGSNPSSIPEKEEVKQPVVEEEFDYSDPMCLIPVLKDDHSIISKLSYINGRTMNFIKPAIGEYELIRNHKAFGDVLKTDWYYDAVHALAARNIIVGFENGSFGSNQPITRAQLVTILVRLENMPVDYTSSSFSDVSVNDWHFPYVEAAYRIGLIAGIGNNQFAPDRYITRQELAVIIYRYFDYKGIFVEQSELKQFADHKAVSDWARDGVNGVANIGIIGGYEDGTFRPYNNATRAEAATMISRCIQHIVNSIDNKFELGYFFK